MKEPANSYRLKREKIGRIPCPMQKGADHEFALWPCPLLLKATSFLILAFGTLKWMQFEVKLPIVRQWLPLIAITAKAGIADYEGRFGVEGWPFPPTEGGLARAVHHGEPDAVRWQNRVQPGLICLPIRLVTPKVFMPGQRLENANQETCQEKSRRQSKKGGPRSLSHRMKINHRPG